VFTARSEFAHHLVRSDEPIVVPRRASPAELDRTISQAMASVERFVRRFPTQWFHFAKHPQVDAVVGDVPMRRAV